MSLLLQLWRLLPCLLLPLLMVLTVLLLLAYVIIINWLHLVSRYRSILRPYLILVRDNHWTMGQDDTMIYVHVHMCI